MLRAEPAASVGQGVDRTIRSAGDANCAGVAEPSRRRALLPLIASGDQNAFRAAARLLPCLGAGESEDFYRSAGSFLERRPASFLGIVAESALLRDRLRYLVTMLPLALVDDLPAQTATVGQRIDALNTVQDARLDGLKQRALAALRSERKELEHIRSDQRH
jgi:hypothetical protein